MDKKPKKDKAKKPKDMTTEEAVRKLFDPEVIEHLGRNTTPEKAPHKRKV